MKEISLIKEGLKVTNSKLSAIVRELLEKVDEVYEYITPWLNNFKEAGIINWLMGIAASLSCLVCLLVLLAALSTGKYYELN